MAAIRALIIFSLCSLCAYAQDPCQSQFRTFRSCLRGQGEGQGQNRDEMKNAFQKCFTDNGCNPPQRGQGQGQGGRAGRVDGQNDQARQQCFQSLKVKFETCIKGKLPGFNFPSKPNGGAPGGGFGGGFGGDHDHDGDDDDHHGGGGHGQGGGNKGNDYLLNACNGDQTKANLVKQCLKNQFQSNKQNQNKQQRCQQKTTCAAQLSPECKKKLEDTQKAMCQCGAEVKADAAADPNCQGANKNQHRGQNKQHDCNKSFLSC